MLSVPLLRCLDEPATAGESIMSPHLNKVRNRVGIKLLKSESTDGIIRAKLLDFILESNNKVRGTWQQNAPSDS